MQNWGIDISKFNGAYPIQAAKAEGVKFIIARIGGADDKKVHFYADSQFNVTYTTCKELGLPVGAYYLFNADNLPEAKAEAEHLLRLLAGKKFEYPIALDIEGTVLTRQSKESLITCVRLCAQMVEAAGYYVTLYASASPFNNQLNDSRLDIYDKWVACYSKSKPGLARSIPYGIWQFGGSVNYIRSNRVAGQITDQNYSYYDYPNIMKEKGLNGYGKDPEPQPTPVEHKCTTCKYCEPLYDSYGSLEGKNICCWNIYKNDPGVVDVTGNDVCGDYEERK